MQNVFNFQEINEDKAKLILKLQSWGLIPKDGEFPCPNCNKPLKLGFDARTTDRWYWRCPHSVSIRKQKKQPCRYKRSLRLGTFFYRSKLAILQILSFVNLWVLHVSLDAISAQLNITKQSTVEWGNFCREVIFQSFFQNPQKLGGPGVEVEFIESKFGKRKYKKSRHVEGQWVLGGFEIGTGRIFMVAVENYDSDTIVPLIEEWVEQGTTIISDCWKEDNCLNADGYDHLSVNHSVTFKEPETKAVALFNGKKKEHIPGNLARYLFYKKCSLLHLDRTIEFFKLAGNLYDPRKAQEDDNEEEDNESDVDGNDSDDENFDFIIEIST